VASNVVGITKTTNRSTMKRIEAVIRPHKLDQVLEALDKHGISGVTVIETSGFGRQRGHSEVVPKRMLILYVADADANAIVDCIANVAQTGQVGDGKLVVSPLERAVRLRTGEEADTVISMDDSQSSI
jgi:nitrogen regulatory protein P-II 1